MRTDSCATSRSGPLAAPSSSKSSSSCSSAFGVGGHGGELQEVVWERTVCAIVMGVGRGGVCSCDGVRKRWCEGVVVSVVLERCDALGSGVVLWCSGEVVCGGLVLQRAVSCNQCCRLPPNHPYSTADCVLQPPALFGGPDKHILTASPGLGPLTPAV